MRRSVSAAATREASFNVKIEESYDDSVAFKHQDGTYPRIADDPGPPGAEDVVP